MVADALLLETRDATARLLGPSWNCAVVGMGMLMSKHPFENG